MTDEMKAKRELLFSGSKNGYDRVDQQTLDAWRPIAGTTRAFWTTARPSGSARPTPWRWRRRRALSL